MKYAAAAAAAVIALIGAVAFAQTTGTPAAPAAPAALAPPPPPSTCAAYPATPDVPTQTTLKSVKELNSGTERVNAYLAAYQSTHGCRVAEIRALEAQTQARLAEARAAQDAALAFRNGWEATATAFGAKGKDKKGR